MLLLWIFPGILFTCLDMANGMAAFYLEGLQPVSAQDPAFNTCDSSCLDTTSVQDLQPASHLQS